MPPSAPRLGGGDSRGAHQGDRTSGAAAPPRILAGESCTVTTLSGSGDVSVGHPPACRGRPGQRPLKESLASAISESGDRNPKVGSVRADVGERFGAPSSSKALQRRGPGAEE